MRDALATLLVAGALTLYAVTEAGIDVAGLDTVRMRASAVFLLGALACGAGAAPNAFTERGVVLPVISVLSVIGAATLVVGLVAITAGSAAFLTALAAGIAVLWVLTTLRHLATPPSMRIQSTLRPRELVKR